jgi:hypothetical protein
LGQRSRKRRTTGGASAAIPSPRNSSAADGVRRRPAGGESSASDPPGDGLARGYARGRAKDEEARQSLEPLAPDERPTAITVAAIVAALIGVGNLILLLADSDLHHRSRVTGGIVFAALMFIAAIFMWRRAYWAVLGFQTLLALSIVISSLALLFAENVEAVIRSLVIIVPAGVLFWFLIRAMARLQMPTRTR